MTQNCRSEPRTLWRILNWDKDSAYLHLAEFVSQQILIYLVRTSHSLFCLRCMHSSAFSLCMDVSCGKELRPLHRQFVHSRISFNYDKKKNICVIHPCVKHFSQLNKYVLSQVMLTSLSDYLSARCSSFTISCSFDQGLLQILGRISLIKHS